MKEYDRDLALFGIFYMLWFYDKVVVEPFCVESKFNIIIVTAKSENISSESWAYPNSVEEFLNIIKQYYKGDVEVKETLFFDSKKTFLEYTQSFDVFDKYLIDWENL